MTTRRHRYIACYERDPAGDAWLVHIETIERCHTHGRTLRQAATRIEEALALWLDRPPAEFELEHRWPEPVSTLSTEVRRARQAAVEASRAAGDVTERAVRRLDAMGVSRRDTAAILGISHQRVQQLLAS